jgi:hypothetical protein
LEYYDQIRPIYLIHINHPTSRSTRQMGAALQLRASAKFRPGSQSRHRRAAAIGATHVEISNAAESHRRNGVGENEADAPRPQLAFGSHWHDGCGHERVADRSGGPPIARRRRTNHFMIVRRIASARVRKRVRINQRIFQARLFDDRHAGLFRPGD